MELVHATVENVWKLNEIQMLLSFRLYRIVKNITITIISLYSFNDTVTRQQLGNKLWSNKFIFSIPNSLMGRRRRTQTSDWIIAMQKYC